MIYVLWGLLMFLVVDIVIFLIEKNRAITIDSKEPFLHDDYDPNKYHNAPQYHQGY